ncbi:MAG: hypothetical protein ACXAC2_00010 [Candidatus Kariarchaeaceae archaeon]|jgi:hypothetical protein
MKYESLHTKNIFKKKIRKLRLDLVEVLRPKDEPLPQRKIDAELMKEFQNLFYIKGQVDLFLHDPLLNSQPSYKEIPESLIQKFVHVPNTVVNGGEVWLAELIAHKYVLDDATLASVLLDGVGGANSDVAVGTGSTAVTQADVDIETAISDANGGLQTTTTTFVGTSLDNKFQVSGFYDTTDAYLPGDPNSLREAGLFATNRETVTCSTRTQKTNRMFNRTVYPVISKSDLVQLTIQWTVEVGTVP